MSKAIVTVPVPDGHTSQRFFEFDLSGELDLRVVDHAILVLGPDEIPVHVFGRGQWSRVEFVHD